MSHHTTLVPAYGRDYKSAKAALADWDAGKDFIIADISDPYDGKPINKEQAQAGTTYSIRYDKMKKFVGVKP